MNQPEADVVAEQAAADLVEWLTRVQADARVRELPGWLRELDQVEPADRPLGMQGAWLDRYKSRMAGAR